MDFNADSIFPAGHLDGVSWIGIDQLLSSRVLVFVRAFINEDGNVSAVKIVKSSDFIELDEAAIDAIIKSKWVPATNINEKVGVWIIIPIDFSLTN